jgi:3-hydroxyacyl-CoA dehydrogenase, C-terminal domain
MTKMCSNACSYGRRQPEELNLGPGAQVILDTLEFGSKIKKTPVVVGNCTGFAVNRVFFPYSMAAGILVDAGLDPYTVDKAIQYGFGMPMGPFRYSLLRFISEASISLGLMVDN